MGLLKSNNNLKGAAAKDPGSGGISARRPRDANQTTRRSRRRRGRSGRPRARHRSRIGRGGRRRKKNSAASALALAGRCDGRDGDRLCTGRGDAAATTWIFWGDGSSRRRRGSEPIRLRRSEASLGRVGLALDSAAAATRIFRRRSEASLGRVGLALDYSAAATTRILWRRAQVDAETPQATGLKVLILLAVQNCVKNLVMRAAVKGDAHFLYVRRADRTSRRGGDVPGRGVEEAPRPRRG